MDGLDAILYFLYSYPLILGILVVGLTIALSIGGLALWRLAPWQRSAQEKPYPEGLNDAVGGAIGVLGVFYGVTVGLVAVDVWQRRAAAEELVSQEAAAIHGLFLSVWQEEALGKLDIGRIKFPSTLSRVLRGEVAAETTEPNKDVCRPLERTTTELIQDVCTPVARLSADYLDLVMGDIWDKQQHGCPASQLKLDREKLRSIRLRLQAFTPAGNGEEARYEEALRGLSQLIDLRRRRVDALDNHLGWVMWTLILVGAVFTMCLAHQFWLHDVWRHRLLVGLLSGGLGLAIWMIAYNDRPFLGKASIKTNSYKGIDWVKQASQKIPPDESCIATLAPRVEK